MPDFNTDPEGFLAELVQQQIQKALPQAQNQQQGGQPPVAQPLTLNIAGQTVNFKDTNELQTALNQAINTAATTNAQLQTQLEQYRADSQTANVTDDSGAVQWDKDTFLNEMQTDVRRGFNYALNHLIFDGKSENAAADLRNTLTESAQMKQLLAAYQFKEQHPEYPGGQQVANIVEQWRLRMNLPYDADGLEAAYQRAIAAGPQNGGLPDFRLAYQQQQWQQQQELQRQQYERQQEQQSQFQGYAPQPLPQTAQFATPAVNPYPNQPMDPRLFNGGGYFAGLPNPTIGQNPYTSPPPALPRTGAPGFNPAGPITREQAEMLSPEQIEQVIAQYPGGAPSNNFGRPW